MKSFEATVEVLFLVVLYILSPLYIVARIILVVAFWGLSTMPATGLGRLHTLHLAMYLPPLLIVRFSPSLFARYDPDGFYSRTYIQYRYTM
jgi:hypothetical protein